MAMTCTICKHPQRAEIEMSILNTVSTRRIASQYGVGYKSVERHAKGHIAQEIQQSQAAKEEVQALDVVSEMVWVNQAAHSIYEKVSNKEKPDLRVALQAVGEIRKQAELWAELQGELNRGTTIELVQHPEWVSLREVIFEALSPWPDARVAVARAILVAGGLDNAYTA